MTVVAYVVHVDPMDQHELIKISTGHEIQFGGVGDGYCYDHSSFDCVETLTAEECRAIDNAENADDIT